MRSATFFYFWFRWYRKYGALVLVCFLGCSGVPKNSQVESITLIDRLDEPYMDRASYLGEVREYWLNENEQAELIKRMRSARAKSIFKAFPEVCVEIQLNNGTELILVGGLGWFARAERWYEKRDKVYVFDPPDSYRRFYSEAIEKYKK